MVVNQLVDDQVGSSKVMRQLRDTMRFIDAHEVYWRKVLEMEH